MTRGLSLLQKTRLPKSRFRSFPQGLFPVWLPHYQTKSGFLPNVFDKHPSNEMNLDLYKNWNVSFRLENIFINFRRVFTLKELNHLWKYLKQQCATGHSLFWDCPPPGVPEAVSNDSSSRLSVKSPAVGILVRLRSDGRRPLRPQNKFPPHSNLFHIFLKFHICCFSHSIFVILFVLNHFHHSNTGFSGINVIHVHNISSVYY